MSGKTFQSAFHKDTLLWVIKRFNQILPERNGLHVTPLYGFCLRYVETYFVFQEFLDGTACLLANIAEASLSSVNTYCQAQPSPSLKLKLQLRMRLALFLILRPTPQKVPKLEI